MFVKIAVCKRFKKNYIPLKAKRTKQKKIILISGMQAVYICRVACLTAGGFAFQFFVLIS
jgi:hypothetical protein